MLPAAFRDLSYEAQERRDNYNDRFSSGGHRRRKTVDENGFADNHLAMFDAKIVYSHNSVLHGKLPNYDQEAKDRGRQVEVALWDDS